jgi:hypothetical protein
MYHTFHQYMDDYSTVEKLYVDMSLSMTWLGHPDPEKAYGLYRNALRPSLDLLLMGRTNVDRNGKVRGPAIDVDMLTNFGATNDGSSPDDRTASGSGALNEPSSTRATQGSILHYPGEKNWHFLINDSWILGGVHAQREFYLASPRVKDNIHDGEHLTVTGRELTGLRAFGYRIHQLMDGSEMAHCVNEGLANAASLAKYCQELRRDSWKDLVNPAATLLPDD